MEDVKEMSLQLSGLSQMADLATRFRMMSGISAWRRRGLFRLAARASSRRR
jgi:hypothetical protein